MRLVPEGKACLAAAVVVVVQLTCQVHMATDVLVV
jgi:hypothetical protein